MKLVAQGHVITRKTLRQFSRKVGPGFAYRLMIEQCFPPLLLLPLLFSPLIFRRERKGGREERGREEIGGGGRMGRELILYLYIFLIFFLKVYFKLNFICKRIFK